MAIPVGFKLAQNPNIPEGFKEVSGPSVAGIVEPALAIGGAALGEAVGGAAGLLTTAVTGDPQAGEAVLRSTQEALTFNPRTPEGKANLEAIAGSDVVQAIGNALTSAEQTLGDQGFDVGGPLGGALAQAIPTAILEFVTLGVGAPAVKGTQRAGRAAAEGIEAAGVATGKALTPVIEAAAPIAQEVVRGVFEFQSPAKQKIAQLIEAGSTDVETAGFKLGAPSAKPETVIGKALSLGGPRVVKDPLAGETIRQGFDPGVIAAVKGSSKADKLALQKMVNIAETVKKNKKFGMRNRASDVTGDLLMGRVKIIQKANRLAGVAIDKVATSLKGKPVNVAAAGDEFIDALEGMGITINQKNGRLIPDFSGSDIEFAGGPKSTIRNVLKRMSDAGAIDAKAAHDMKRFIDTEVTYGKSLKGLTAGPERALKNFRRSINETLRENFPRYAEANTAYKETIEALEEFQKVAGNRMNLIGENANKDTGTLMRRLMGNARSRINLLDSIDQIESVARKHGGDVSQLKIGGKVAPGLEMDLLTQVLFADELDAVFGPAARTSLQGQFDQALKASARAARTKTGAADLAAGVVGDVVEKARNINEAAAFKAIKELLKGAK